MKLGIVADDNTGATDAAGMLTERGVRTVLVLDADPQTSLADFANFDAIVIGTQNRSVAPSAAAEAARQGVEILEAWGADRFQLKYCSTFDSTPEGNIGSTLDAATDALAARATIVCPALPVNARTVYQGHLFVGGQLLSDSPLRDHPLNPMTDANLVRWLEYQTPRKVTLVDLSVIRRGADAIGKELERHIADGAAYVVTDATQDEDLHAIAQATRNWPLLSGASGITAALAELHYAGRDPLRFDQELAAASPATLVVSGSQSSMTRRQTLRALAQGWADLRLDVSAVLRGDWNADALADRAATELGRSRNGICGSTVDW